MKSIHIFTAIALITAPLVLVNADDKKPNLGRDAIYGYESVEQYGFILGNSGGEVVAFGLLIHRQTVALYFLAAG